MIQKRPLGLAAFAICLLAGSCSTGGDSSESEATPSSGASATTEIVASGAALDPGAGGIRLVSPTEGADIQENPPDDLVILDVRTPEEFAEGHLDGAIMIDFYEEDFADQLAELDPEVPYLLYCRSGNRSGQTTAIMQELGFTDVADVDGGIVSWVDAGLSIVGG